MTETDNIVNSIDFAEELSKLPPANSIKTGVSKLDEMTEGLQGGEVIVVSAPTGQGKTTLCQTLTQNFADKGINCLWFSFEVGMREFFKKFNMLPSFFLPRLLRQNSMDWLEKKIVEGVKEEGCQVVFIDHLHYLLEMSKMAEAKSLSLLVGTMMRDLKKIAIEYDVVIFLISHMRKVQYDKMPEIDDLRDSSFVGQESDIVMFLKRMKNDEDYTNQAVLKVAKNRRTGNLGNIKLELVDNKFREFNTGFEKI